MRLKQLVFYNYNLKKVDIIILKSLLSPPSKIKPVQKIKIKYIILNLYAV